MFTVIYIYIVIPTKKSVIFNKSNFSGVKLLNSELYILLRWMKQILVLYILVTMKSAEEDRRRPINIRNCIVYSVYTWYTIYLYTLWTIV